MADKSLTVDRLRSVLCYNADTGEFTWAPHFRRQNCGQAAGGKNAAGYIYIQIDGVGYRASRLAWLWAHGVWPENEIDHINRVRHDNRLANLRDVTRQVNLDNRDISRNGFKREGSGCHGVYLHRGRWLARMKVGAKRVHVGYFDTEIEADAARQRAEVLANAAVSG